jgi:uncharacterized Zn finger protein (UPF0148 family)
MAKRKPVQIQLPSGACHFPVGDKSFCRTKADAGEVFCPQHKALYLSRERAVAKPKQNRQKEREDREAQLASSPLRAVNPAFEKKEEEKKNVCPA